MSSWVFQKFVSEFNDEAKQGTAAPDDPAVAMDVDQPLQKIPNCSRPRTFEGVDPCFWISTIENAFICNSIRDDKKLPYAVSYLGPSPGKFWSAYADVHANLGWEDLK